MGFERGQHRPGMVGWRSLPRPWSPPPTPGADLGLAGVCSEGIKSTVERGTRRGGQAGAPPLRSHRKGDLWANDGNLNPQRRIGNVAPTLNYWIFLWLNLISQQNFPFF